VPFKFNLRRLHLGKTAQTIAYLALSRHRKKKGAGGWKVGTGGFKGREEPVLVVAPASLLENWRREIRVWAPALRVGFYHGNHAIAATRHAWEEAAASEDKGAAFDVIIACYSLFERDSEDTKLNRGFLRKLTFSHLVLDEAHLVKNRNTQRSKRLDSVAAKARRRVLLTGTPLQNNLLELEALIHLVLPGLLEDGALGGGVEDEEDEEMAAQRVARVKVILAPFILRRLKEEVAHELIPKKQEKVLMPMTAGQGAVYAEAVEKARRERRRQQGNEQEGDAAATALATAANGGAMAKVSHLFVHLRKIANHPLLVRNRYTDTDVAEMAGVCFRKGIFGPEAKHEKVIAHVKGLSDFDLHQLCADAQLKGALKHKELPISAIFDAGKTQRWGCHSTPGGCQIGYMYSTGGCHQLNPVLTAK
jgi:SWI/SNF-related matrix-associated actin-dependent regulator 1 of chromatin subfamily A